MTGGTITTTGTLKVDTSVMATRLRVQKGIDSVNANVNLKVNISDTATMLSSYYNKTATDSKLALKLNISDTATMLSPYARTLALGGYIPYTGATGAIDLNAKTVVNISKLGINTTTVPTILLRVIGDNNSTSRIAMRGYSSDANSSSIRVTKFRGTAASPQAPLSGDGLGKFELAGYGTTSSDGYPQASFEGIATENWGATARGAKVQVKVTPNTTTTQAIALTINQDKSAVFENSITGTSLIKTGGTSSQFLKADGSVDANAYLNISDTATMLSGYKTYYPRAALSAGTGITYNASTGVITNSSPSTGGTVTSVATNTGSGITGGTITSSGTIAADTSVLSTKANVTASLLSKVSSVSGTSPIASSGGLTPAISISQSSGSTNGYLSSTDWTTFNNKGSGSVTSIATDATMTGGTITTSGTLKVDTSVMATRLRVQKGIDSLGAAKQANITLTTTGTSGAATFTSNILNIPNYGSALSGYVTLGTDQTITATKTFNNTTTGNGGLTLQRTDFATNENILKFTTGSTVNWKIGTGSNGDNFLFNNGTTNVANLTTSGVLTTNGFIKDGGTSSQYLMADGSVSTLTNPVTGSGTTNYLPKFTGASTIGNSAITDDGTTVTLVSRAANVNNALTVGAGQSIANDITWTNNTGYGLKAQDGTRYLSYTTAGGTILGSSGSAKTVIQGNGGNTLIGSTSDNGSGAILQVTGVTTLSSRLNVNGATDDGSTALNVTGAGKFSGTLGVTGATTTSNIIQTNLTGGLAYRAYYGSGNNRTLDVNIDGPNGDAHLTFNTTYNSGWKYFVSNFAARIKSGDGLIFSVAASGTAGNTITWNDALTIASTGAATFSGTVRVEGSYLQIVNATNPSLYINNTVVQWQNYLKSNNNIAFSDAVRDVLTLGYNGSASYFQGGNVLIGTTTDAGYKLDVNGTGRFQGDALYVYTTGNIEIGRDITYSTPYMAVGFGGRANANNKIFGARDATDGIFINAATGRGISMVVNGGATTALTLASTGAATFSSSVTASQLILTGTVPSGSYGIYTNLTIGTPSPIGMYLSPNYTTAVTGYVTDFAISPTSDDGTRTTAQHQGLVINDIYKGTGHTITDNYGLIINNISAGTNNTALSVGMGLTQFLDKIELSSTIRLGGYSVAGLPTAGTLGRIAYVTDALAPTYGATVVGGGSVRTLVFDNGTNWTVH